MKCLACLLKAIVTNNGGWVSRRWPWAGLPLLEFRRQLITNAHCATVLAWWGTLIGNRLLNAVEANNRPPMPFNHGTNLVPVSSTKIAAYDHLAIFISLHGCHFSFILIGKG